MASGRSTTFDNVGEDFMRQTGIRLLYATVLILLLAALAPFASAQITQTGIRGLVKDSSGGVVPNVTVTLTDTATQSVKTTESGIDGAFVFVNIMSGTYN